MIQFNLLPDIKIQYLKSRRQKRLVVLGSVVTIIAAVAIFLTLMVIVHVLQKKNLSDLNRDIDTVSSELKNTDDLTKILTVQNQLKALPALHDEKVVASRLSGYIGQVTPVKASIAKLSVDFEQQTITISGATDSLATVNTYTDTLKFTTYTSGGDDEQEKAFSDVVLTSFGRDDKGSTYVINLKFDPVIFSQDTDIRLTVPQITTTRSEVSKPAALFQESEGSTDNTTGGN